MAWPTDSISLGNLDNGTDAPASARPDIENGFQVVKDILASHGEPNGVCPLEADGTIAADYLDGASILSALFGDVGAGSGLDADLLDGQEGATYSLVDASRKFSPTAATGLEIEATTSLTAAVRIALTLDHITDGVAAAANFGTGLRFSGHNDLLVTSTLAELHGLWVDPTDGSEIARVSLHAMDAGSLTEQWYWESGHAHLPAITTPAAPADGVFVYAKADGLYVRTTGGEVGPLAAASAGAAHSGLTGLGADDHTQYVLASGSRAFTGSVDLGAAHALWEEVGTPGATPATNHWFLYFTSAGLKYKDDVGTEYAVATGSATDHGLLTGLADNDHPQYLLLQPAADVVLNESGGDFDWRLEAVGKPNMLRIDAGLARMYVADSPGGPAQEARLNVDGGNNEHGLFVGTTGASKNAVYAQSDTGYGVVGLGTAFGGGGVHAIRSVDTSAAVLKVTDQLGGTLGGPLVQVDADPTAVGIYFEVTQNVSNKLFRVSDAEVIINDSGDAFDFRVEGDTLANLLFADGSADVVNVNGSLTTARFNVTGGAKQAIHAVASGGQAGIGVAVTGTGRGVSALTQTGEAIYGEVSGNKTIAKFYRDVGSATTDAVTISLDNATDNGTVLNLETDGGGSLIECRQGTSGLALPVWNLNTGADILWREHGGDPVATPNDGYAYFYLKAVGSSTGLFLKDAMGTVVALSIPAGTNTGDLLRWNAQWEATSLVRVGSAGLEYHATNGATMKEGVREVQLTGLSGSSVEVQDGGAELIKAGEKCFGVVVKNDAAVTGCDSFNVGTTDGENEWGSELSTGAGNQSTQSDFQIEGDPRFDVNTSVFLTPVNGSFSGGDVTVTVFYREMSA